MGLHERQFVRLKRIVQKVLLQKQLLLVVFVLLKSFDLGMSGSLFARLETDLCLKNACCFQDTETCGFESLVKENSTFIYPGGETRCIDERSPYRFEVVRGRPDKLLIYFQGGGGCFNRLTSYTTCRKAPMPITKNGIFDRTDARNPYQDWTVIHVLYCSGDIFMGNTTRPYIAARTKNKNITHHAGLVNAGSVIDWIAHQNLSLSDVAVMGCSAGTLAAQLFANSILDRLNYQHAVIVLDSYVGIAPGSVAGRLFSIFGSCDNGLFAWSESLQKMCHDGSLTFPKILEETIQAYPKVTFAALNSKKDLTQRFFYSFLGFAFDRHRISTIWKYTKMLMSPQKFYEELVQTLFPLLKYPNFKAYFVEGSQHCFSNVNYLYSANTRGKLGTKEMKLSNQGAQYNLVTWFHELGDFSRKVECIMSYDWFRTRQLMKDHRVARKVDLKASKLLSRSDA